MVGPRRYGMNLHLKGLQHALDARAVHLYPLPQAVGVGLDDHVPLDVAQRVIRPCPQLPVVLEEMLALAQRGAKVADDVEERVLVPSHLPRVADAVAPQGLLGLGDDVGEDVEAPSEVAELGSELVVLGAWVRGMLAMGARGRERRRGRKVGEESPLECALRPGTHDCGLRGWRKKPREGQDAIGL